MDGRNEFDTQSTQDNFIFVGIEGGCQPTTGAKCRPSPRIPETPEANE